jgi:hypothetical protein
MKTTVSSEADEINSMPDGVARRIDDTRLVCRHCRADGHPGGCPTEGARAPDGGWVSGGGPTAGLGGGPTGDYIRAPAPHFWALSSSAQSHLQEMRVRRVHTGLSVGRAARPPDTPDRPSRPPDKGQMGID